MTHMISAWKWLDKSPDLDGGVAGRWIRLTLWPVVVALSILKFFYLSADFPNYSPWMIDQAKFTDEGWWGNAAVMHALTGNWYVAGDYNPAVALPVWPTLLAIVFHFTGVSVLAARALNVAISIATLAVVFLLVRRYFAFAFNRLAILDTPVVFEFCLLMLVASFASASRIWPFVALALLIPVMILTKTTAVLLAPAVFWIAWSAMGYKMRGLLRALFAVAVVPAALLKGYAALVTALGYGGDYDFFFKANAMSEIDWRQTFPTLSNLFENCFWIDRVLYPIALLILVLTVAWKRKLWSNPLFAAAWIALAAQAAFIFRRQDDYAPRYFLVMLAPMVWVVTLTFAELITHARKTAIVLFAAMAAALVANVVMIGQFLTHRDYDLQAAATGILNVIRSHPEQKPFLLGVSGAQISLMTGIPSINDGYSTEDMPKKLASYQPGWYLTWNSIAPEDESLLAPYRLEKMASYPAFDDDERSPLILYMMTRR